MQCKVGSCLALAITFFPLKVSRTKDEDNQKCRTIVKEVQIGKKTRCI